MANKIFFNLPVKDLDKSKKFFSSLGFTFNPKFTNENAACMIIGKNIYSMLVVEKFFLTFTTKSITDSKKSTEVLLAISLDNKNQVDEMMSNVLKSGGKEHRPIQDLGFMYSRSFEDLDGHIWEAFFMDETKSPQNNK